MSLSDLKDLSWGVLIPGALLLVAPILWTISVCFSRPRRGLLLCILFLPIYQTSQALLTALAGVFESSQAVILADLLVIVVFLGFVLTRRASSVLKELERYAVSAGLLTFLAAGLLSLTNSSSLPRSLMALLAYSQLFLLTFIVEAVPVPGEDLWPVVRYWLYSYWIVLGAGVFGLVCLWANWETFAVHAMQQVRATFRFPNQFSLYLTATLPVLFSLLFTERLSRMARRLLASSLPVALLLVWFSGSRSGLAAMGVAAAVIGAFHATKARTYAWVAVFVLALGAGYSVSRRTSSENLRTSGERYSALWESLSGQDTGSSAFSFYQQTEATSMDAFLEHPIVGGGVGAVLNRSIEEDQPLETHITYIGILGETGLVGISVCLLTAGFAIRNLLRARRLATSDFVRELANGSLAALAGLFVHSLANYDWRSRHLWLLLGLTTVVRMAAQEESQAGRLRATVLRPGNFRLPHPAIASASLRSE